VKKLDRQKVDNVWMGQDSNPRPSDRAVP